MTPETPNPASAGAQTGSGDSDCVAAIDLQDSGTLPKKQARNCAARLRRHLLVEHLHRPGPSPLGHFLHEVEDVTVVIDGGSA
jgi:hypothetical protein